MPARESPLGEFEVIVLLAVLHCAGTDTLLHGAGTGTGTGPGTGVEIRDEIERRSGRKVGRGAVYVTLDRLDEKGLLTSRFGASSPERGGHPRRFFSVTAAGLRAVKQSLATLERMRAGLDPVLGDR
jgi:PadR family transcriptional regulator, regulatory protein PadR